jgi:hypothetical protein
MIKYFLSYIAGAKGDFLCNFLNYEELFFEDFSTAKSLSKYPNLKGTKDIENIINQDVLISSCHPENKINYNIFKNKGIKTICIDVEKQYLLTVKTESLLKNYLKKIDPILEKKLIIYSASLFGIKLSNIKKIKFFVDIFLESKNEEITDEKRFDFLISKLENINVTKNYNEDYNFDYRLNYSNIYIKKNYQTLHKIKPSFNPYLYEELLEKTWLPNIVNCFGYDIDLRKYGYRDY